MIYVNNCKYIERERERERERIDYIYLWYYRISQTTDSTFARWPSSNAAGCRDQLWKTKGDGCATCQDQLVWAALPGANMTGDGKVDFLAGNDATVKSYNR